MLIRNEFQIRCMVRWIITGIISEPRSFSFFFLILIFSPNSLNSILIVTRKLSMKRLDLVYVDVIKSLAVSITETRKFNCVFVCSTRSRVTLSRAMLHALITERFSYLFDCYAYLCHELFVLLEKQKINQLVMSR